MAGKVQLSEPGAPRWKQESIRASTKPGGRFSAVPGQCLVSSPCVLTSQSNLLLHTLDRLPILWSSASLNWCCHCYHCTDEKASHSHRQVYLLTELPAVDPLHKTHQVPGLINSTQTAPRSLQPHFDVKALQILPETCFRIHWAEHIMDSKRRRYNAPLLLGNKRHINKLGYFIYLQYF